MFKDDDEEEENTFGVTRYPCMPSLVALQQMRNRLHLAYLGRKLMKWTALATGRELRRLAQELYEVYDGFAEDLRNAFILLARSRYFFPHLNAVVSEDIGKKAGVVVQQCGRTVSGVKIIQFEIFETEFPPYPHLGLEKGGQTILETKKAWLELLRRLIMMMQLRAGFLMVELANRNANKKMNVLKRIVIPRTNLSVGYILTELEEMAREEFHRLQKVKEKKIRDYDLRHKKDEPKKQPSSCRICEIEQKEPEIPIIKPLIENIEPIPIIAITPESVDEPDLIPSTISHDKLVSIKEEPKIRSSSCKICGAEIAKLEIPTIKQLSENIEPIPIIAITPESVDEPDLIPSTISHDKLVSIKEEPKIRSSSCIICGAEIAKPEIETIKQLSENIRPRIVKLAITPESAAKPDLIPSNIKSDITTKEFSLKVVILQEPESSEPFVELYATSSSKSSIINEGRNEKLGENRLEYLKSQLNELIVLGKEFLETGVDKVNINEFLKMCEESKLKLEQFFAVDDYPKVDTKLERKLEHLKCHLREVIDITKDFKPKVTLTSSIENFIKMCEDVDEKLDIYKQGIRTPSTSVDNDNVKLEEFKDIITDVEKITKEYNKRGLLSSSAEAFLQSCCEMKSKIDKCMCCKKNRVTIPIQPSIETQKSEVQPAEEQTPSINSKIQHLIKHIDETINLGIEARQEGVISDSVEDIIKSFDEIKSRITYRDEKSEKLQNLHLNIEEIINLTERLKTDGIVTASVEDFLKLCEETINKLYVNQKRSPSTLENDSKVNSFSCMDSCTNKTDAKLTNAEPNRFNEERPLLIDVAPCDSCSGVVQKKDISKENVCITCSQPDEIEDTSRSQTSTSSEQSQEILSESSEKGVTSNDTQENQLPLENKIETSPTGLSTTTVVDSKLGYFEKKVQKKVKVTRTQNTDGTISEQRETITIRKEKHDPTETEMVKYDDDTFDDTSDENIYEQVNICILPNLTQRGFIRSFRQTRSDSGCKHTPYGDPCLRFCLSVDNLCLTMQEQMSFYDTNNLNEIELLDTEIDANK